MQNEKIYSEIIAHLVKTRLEANILLAELDELEKSCYRLGEGDFDNTLKKSVRAKVGGAIETLITLDGHEGVIKNLRAKVGSLTPLTLTLSFEPTPETISRIYTWVNQNVGEAILLDLKINQGLLGGATIEFKGKISEKTLLSKVEQYFSNTHVNV